MKTETIYALLTSLGVFILGTGLIYQSLSLGIAGSILCTVGLTLIILEE